jgi:hypothetical protein
VGGSVVGGTAVSPTSVTGDEQAAKNIITRTKLITANFLNIITNIFISPFD